MDFDVVAFDWGSAGRGFGNGIDFAITGGSADDESRVAIVISDKGDVFVGGDVSDGVMSDLSRLFDTCRDVPSSGKIERDAFLDFDDIGIVVL